MSSFYRLADDYQNHADEALKDAEKFLANPINAYLFVKRFTTELPKVKELLHNEESIKGKVNCDFIERQ